MRGTAALAAALLACGAAAARASDPPPIVLVTLDTTRADRVGSRPGGASLTPNLDTLARAGTRFSNALTPSPLTLPAHCSLMTGLDPPRHGVRDNGVGSLPEDVPTLAAALARRGYATGAVIASRVLDRRFGLARGFETYDDAIVAEQTGEQGYPERDAAAVTGAALAWASKLPAGRPYFLWVHYYDAHAPYAPPGDWAGRTADERYDGEIAYVDREVGRLLAGLPGAGRRIVAAVGDHGEMLGEHGEKEHGVFLYRASLEVPLLIAGPSVASDRVIATPAATRGLPATLLRLAGLTADAAPFGPGLPGIGPSADSSRAPAVYGETDLPASAYGWSPLASATDARYRLIVAPRPELYDLRQDPAESRNLWGGEPEVVRRLQRVIADATRAARPAARVTPSAELAESLRRLGYLSGSSPRAGSIDPKDGIRMLDELEEAKDLTRRGRAREAAAALEGLVKRSPGNVPFLARLAEAQAASGETGRAIETLGEALELNPGLDFLHLQFARLCVQAGQTGEARASYRRALALNPRFAAAWFGLAELAARSGPAGEELRILREGEAAGTHSGALYARLAQVELPSGDVRAAQLHADAAVRLLPTFAPGWWVAGEVAERQGRTDDAIRCFEKAAALGLEDPRALLHLGAAAHRRRPHARREALPRARRPARPGRAVGGGSPPAPSQQPVRSKRASSAYCLPPPTASDSPSDHW